MKLEIGQILYASEHDDIPMCIIDIDEENDEVIIEPAHIPRYKETLTRITNLIKEGYLINIDDDNKHIS